MTQSLLTRRLIALIVGSVLAVGWLSIVSIAAWADDAPYRDTHASGTITLCGKDGQPVTSGSVNDRPFVWRAVSSQAPPAPYDGSDALVSLYVFLPRQGSSPSDWVGVPLTAVTEYSDDAHPMAQTTILDPPLNQFSDQIVVKNWDGHLQLRMYSSAPGLPTNTNTYAAADIAVHGDAWTLVSGGSDACGAPGDAKSKETYLPTYDKLVKQAERKRAHASSQPSSAPTSSTSADGAGDPGTPGGSGSASAAAAPGSTGSSSSSGTSPIPLVAGLVALGIVAGGGIWWWQTARR